ncbi:MAG: SGNH/GDSL hydrolase family protein [Gemmataceae bacterium]
MKRIGSHAVAPLLALLLLGQLSSRLQAEEFFFKDGDRIVIIGDSITEQHLYSNYVEMWTLSRFPAWKLAFRNVGIGGDVSPGGNGRFKRDVLSFNPTAMTVDFGMNDGGYQDFDEGRYKRYMTGLQGMADQAKEARIRVAWITPQPVEHPQEPGGILGYNQTLERYSAGVKEIADKNGGLFVDQFHPYQAVLDKARAAKVKDMVGGGDAVHPGGPGQALMAASILRGLHFPALVSSVEIDAGSGSPGKIENCKVTEVKTGDGGLSFMRQDNALPFFPEEAKTILKWTPIREELNEYRLKVNGLKDGKYEVRLGGKKVASFTAEELAKGVNLTETALSAGPVADQVNKLWNAVKAKNGSYHDRIYRGIVLASVPDYLQDKDLEPKREAAMKERSAKVAELDEAVSNAKAIEPHKVEVVPEAK